MTRGWSMRSVSIGLTRPQRGAEAEMLREPRRVGFS